MRVHHIAFRTFDIDRCVSFYRDVLGLPQRSVHYFEDRSLRSVWLQAGATVVMIEQARAGEPLPPAGTLDLVAFAIDPDARERFRERFARAGIAIEAETAHTLYVRDPDGRRIGLSCHPLSDG